MAMEAVAFLLLQLIFLRLVSSETNFTFNGFHHANLSLDGAAYISSTGIVSLTETRPMCIGHAFYPSPFPFKDTNTSSVIDFSTNFVFSIDPKYPNLGGHGLVFGIFSTDQLKNCLPSQYFGLPDYNTTNITASTLNPTKILAIEFDVVENFELMDIDEDHVGIDVSSLISSVSRHAAYYPENSSNPESISLLSGDPIRAWIEYDARLKLMNVAIAPIPVPKPYKALISFPVDLSPALDEYMYVGFSASTGMLTAHHNVMGWSFSIGGRAQDLDLAQIPFAFNKASVFHKKGFAIGIALASLMLLFLIVSGAVSIVRRIRYKDEKLEEWEMEYGAHRFKYWEIVSATKGFREKNFIGSGGFGRVYRGVLRSTGAEVAIKRIAQNSRQGMREFVAEITSMGNLRHRNLVQLHGWCRRQDNLFLVYEYIPNGSLDKLLYMFDFDSQQHQQQKKKKKKKRSAPMENTAELRYKILMHVAQALLYLHEECEQRVIHRDVKSSNVLIDANFNAKIGDFGLARTYEHGSHPKTTYVVGTLGYLAPEFTKTGRATTSTDVYSYGVLVLEVVSGRRPIEPQKEANELVLVDWARELHSQGRTVQVIDQKLEEFDFYEVNLVVNLGLLCAQPNPDARPSMRSVVQALAGDASLRDIHPGVGLNSSSVSAIGTKDPGFNKKDSGMP